MKRNLKKIVPNALKTVLSKILKLFKYDEYDSSTYWKKRASEEGQKAVMWRNQKYNELYRKLQKKILLFDLCLILFGV